MANGETMSSGREAIKRARRSVRLPVAAALATVLASICLGETFVTGTWFLPTALSAVVVVAACEVARRRSVPRVLVPVVGVLALVVYLVLRYARGEATFGLLPDPSAVRHLLDLAAAGNKDIARFAAPISVSRGVELITVAGVGFIALLVDTLAVTARRAALAGLPLLALYTVPAALAPDGVTWQAFALAGAGYLGLLLAESRERVTRWGRPMRFSPGDEWRDDAQTAPLAQLGRRVGAAALGIALVVPAVLPEISMGTFGFGGGPFGRGTGGGEQVSVVNPILDLGRDLRRGENRPVIRYEGDPTYLRMVGLDLFDGNTWKPSKYQVPNEQTLEQVLPRPPGLTAAAQRGRKTYNINVLELDQQWLPLPYPPQKVTIEGRWLYDEPTFNVFSTNTSTRNKSYRVISRDVRPTAQQLREAPHVAGPSSLDRYVQTPLNLPPVVAQTAKAVTSSAATDYDKALALQTWLRDPAQFTYSTQVSREVGDVGGSAGLAAFLRARKGYCVHFASAMAVMARLLEIPARVAVGFTPGERGKDGSYTVGLHDAHSWPELYFEGTGWVAFEPTPADRTGQPPAWAQPADTSVDPSAGPSSTASPTSSATSVIPPSRTGDDRDARAVPDGDEDKPFWQRLRLPMIPTLLLLGFLVLLMLPSLTRKAVRRRRWRRAVSPEAIVGAAWAELHDTLVDFGFTWHESDSARRGAERVAQELNFPPRPTAAIERLAGATERLHYAPELGEVGDLRADMAEVDAALASTTSRTARARARLLPRSTRSFAAVISDRLADGGDLVDATARRLRSRLLPRLRRTG